MSVKEAIVFFDNLELDEVKTVIAKEILKEIKSRLRFLDTVGLDYLNLSPRRNSFRRRRHRESGLQRRLAPHL